MKLSRVMIGVLALVMVLSLLPVQTTEAETLPPEYWYVYGPYIDKITYPVIKDYNVRLLAFEAGELSLTGVLPRDLDRIKTNRPDAHIIFTVGINSLGAMHFNVQNWPVKYPEVRKALAHLWNRDKIIAESPLRGIAVKDTTIVPPTHGAFVNTDTDFEKLYPYDPAKAKELLAKVFVPCPHNPSIWCDPKEGMKEVEIELLSLPEATSPTYWWIAQYIKSEAEKVGLKVKVVAVSSRELDARTSAGTAVAWIIGWSFGRFPTFMYYFFHSREIRPGGWNEWKVNNTRLDELLDKFYYARDINEAIKYAREAQTLLADIIPWIPTYTSVGITAWDGKLDRDSLLLAYAPPMKDPVGYSWFWWNTVKYSDRTYGGTLNYYITVDITTFHPAIYLWATEADLIFRVYAYTMVTRPDDIYAEPRIPLLLKSWSLEETTYGGSKAYKFTLTLRDGVKWQDGVDVTAEDWAYTLLKFGKELKTRRYYGPYIDNIIDVNVVNKTTLEVYLKDYGWPDIYTFTEFVILPKHIFERMTNPLDDPSLVPHPFVKGLTAMVGNGPYALTKREIAYAELTWNPWYYWRHPERTVKITSVEIPSKIDEGVSFRVRATLLDYYGARATNASASIVVSGPTTVTVPGTHLGNGVFEFAIPGLPAGEYTLTLKASQPILLWSVDNSVTYKVTVGVPGAPPPTPVVELKPVTISLPGAEVKISPPAPPSIPTPEVKVTTPTTELTAPQSVKTATEAVGAVPSSTMAYGASGLAVIALVVALFGMFTVRK